MSHISHMVVPSIHMKFGNYPVLPMTAVMYRIILLIIIFVECQHVGWKAWKTTVVVI